MGRVGLGHSGGAGVETGVEPGWSRGGAGVETGVEPGWREGLLHLMAP